MSMSHSVGYDSDESPTRPDDDTQNGRQTSSSNLHSSTVSHAFPPHDPSKVLPPKIDNYDLFEILGQGGFGIVWKAYDTKLKRLVAIKMMLSESASSRNARSRFAREARAMASVRHENVIRIYSVEEQPVPYFVMELIPGETLQRRLARTGPLAISEVVRLGAQLARGLAAAHTVGLIHRDMKPANILLDGVPATAKIADFGLACVSNDPDLTTSGMIVGTPLYMAPEQACADEVDHRADLYSFGGVLYTMLTGKPPVLSSKVQTVLHHVVLSPMQPIQPIRPDAPRWLIDIVSKLMAKDPNHRFATALDVATALELGENTPEIRTPATPAERSRSNRWPMLPLSLALVASCVGIGLALWLYDPTVRVSPATLYTFAATANTNPVPPTRLANAPATKPVPASKPAPTPPTTAMPVYPIYSADRQLKTHAPISAPIKTSSQTTPDVDLSRLPKNYINEFGMEFVMIAAGEVTEYWRDQRTNTRKFTIPLPFYFGVHEVTLKQWEDVVGPSSVVSEFSRRGASAHRLKGLPDSVVDRYPVNGISWDNTQVFVEALNRKSANKNWVYRLPLAGEWQAACQGGSERTITDLTFGYYFKDGPSKTLDRKQASVERSIDEGPSPVGSFSPNSLGIFDLHGNVAEFLYDEAYRTDSNLRYLMGGSYKSSVCDCSIFRRTARFQTAASPGTGLRVIRVPVVPPSQK